MSTVSDILSRSFALNAASRSSSQKPFTACVSAAELVDELELELDDELKGAYFAINSSNSKK
ncbi:MAG: hypothetical protein JWO53_671 [Chlamydiia bacterium]|nr:hypothetical protein [Chlamydiia bacterium]